MKRYYCILLLSFSLYFVYGQTLNIKRSFTANMFVKVKDSLYKDTTLFVNYFIENGKIKEVQIDCVNVNPNVDKAYFMMGGKNYWHYWNLRKAMIKSAEKFDEWSKVAKDNNVTNYVKEIDEIKHLGFHAVFHVKDKGYFTTMYNGIDFPFCELTPNFLVNSIGVSSIFLGHEGINAFQYKTPEGYVPSLWSLILSNASDANKEVYKFSRTFIRFLNTKSLQTFIDALNGEDVLLEYNEKIKNNKKTDELFK